MAAKKKELHLDMHRMMETIGPNRQIMELGKMDEKVKDDSIIASILSIEFEYLMCNNIAIFSFLFMNIFFLSIT